MRDKVECGNQGEGLGSSTGNNSMLLIVEKNKQTRNLMGCVTKEGNGMVPSRVEASVS